MTAEKPELVREPSQTRILHRASDCAAKFSPSGSGFYGGKAPRLSPKTLNWSLPHSANLSLSIRHK